MTRSFPLGMVNKLELPLASTRAQDDDGQLLVPKLSRTTCSLGSWPMCVARLAPAVAVGTGWEAVLATVTPGVPVRLTAGVPEMLTAGVLATVTLGVFATLTLGVFPTFTVGVFTTLTF